MGTRIIGRHEAAGKRFALVISRYNDFITGRLLSGAVDTLERHGCDTKTITEVWVPGSFEVPLAARQLAASGGFDAVIALGCVIRGHTPHFEFVASEVARGLARAALETGVPVTFGVVTADTLEQAIERAGTKSGNKGAEAAMAAMEMAGVMSQLADLKAK
jgi:6,7-dimethyl-8-ribityllumazine synthase